MVNDIRLNAIALGGRGDRKGDRGGDRGGDRKGDREERAQVSEGVFVQSVGIGKTIIFDFCFPWHITLRGYADDFIKQQLSSGNVIRIRAEAVQTVFNELTFLSRKVSSLEAIYMNAFQLRPIRIKIGGRVYRDRDSGSRLRKHYQALLTRGSQEEVQIKIDNSERRKFLRRGIPDDIKVATGTEKTGIGTKFTSWATDYFSSRPVKFSYKS